MQFNSIDFMLFFLVVLAVYFIVPRKLRNIWLLITSYYFYMSWNPKYAILMFFSTLVTYVSGILVGKCSDGGETKAVFRKKAILLVCLGVNLFILFFFKYANLVLDSLSTFLQYVNLGTIERRVDLLLPVGISFYTFQVLGYIIDVYRGDIKAEKNFLRYALFVSFFPQLVAGPIGRSKNLLRQMNQIEKIKLWNVTRITSGAILMVWGLFMKMVIADRVSILVNNVFDNYFMYGSTELCLAAVGYALQIYCDFGSYSLVAIGTAKIMGFSLMENFNTPYFATSIKDFWGRWHISLSTWFRDYLYIPMGGNRKGPIRKGINKVIVFLLSGLWHGADLHFVIWGGIHGIYQVIADATSNLRKKATCILKIKTDCMSWKLLQMVSTFLLVDLAWIFFRADSVADAMAFIKRIFLNPTPWLLFNGGIYELGLDRVEMNVLIFSTALLFLVEVVRYKKKITIDVFLKEQNLWFEWFVVIVLIVMLFIFGEYGPTFDAQQFIYFQF